MNLKMLCRGIVLSMVVAIGATGVGCASDKAVISQANQAHASLEPAVVEDPVLSNYIQEVGDRVIDAARELSRQGYGPDGKEDNSWMFSKDMRFHFVNSKTINAFTTGGEHMYIYTALFQKAKSEDELAAVMAHEFAHIYARHVHKGMNRQYAILGAAAAAGAAGYAAGGDEKGREYAGMGAGAAALIGQFVGMGFGRKDEHEADKLGFAFYSRAGWDPSKFGDFFQRMIDMGQNQGPEMLSGHPSLESRVEAARERAGALPPEAKEWRRPPVASPERFEELQARSVEIGKSMPSDASLENAQELLSALPRSCLTPAVLPDQQKAEQRVLMEQKRTEEQAVQRPRRRR
ncbi:MAG TPA: M48 family metalloprotease [Tepidisphaeraceae bacterium]|nr:M48 family metalloprotease [Tepidisphaeraceae bacterium]